MIIAVDFDGILFENAFPSIGRPNYKMISFIRQLMNEGHEVILWTSRTSKRLEEAIDACNDYGLHFCSVNENAPSNLAQYVSEYPVPSPKVYADVYLDDRDSLFMAFSEQHSYTSAIDYLIGQTRFIVDRIQIERDRRAALDKEDSHD